MAGGKRKLVEIKSDYTEGFPLFVQKAEAARERCCKQGLTFEVWKDSELKQYENK
jgi:hypothetical protein